MVRFAISQLMCVLLVLSVPTPTAGTVTNQEKQPTIQEQLVVMEAGTIVEIKKNTKEKITGRLGPLSADSFEVQVANGKSFESQSIRYDEVKSVKRHGAPASAHRTGVLILAWLGVLFIALTIMGAVVGA